MPVTLMTDDDRKKPEPPKQPDTEKGYKHGGKAKKMAAGGFTREPKMATTEPSVDEVKMKKGGSAKKMADGGAPMIDPRMLPPRGRRGGMPMAMARPAARSAPVDPREAAAMLASRTAGRPMMKAGGKAKKMAEGGAAETAKEMKMDKAQDKAMIQKAFKQHDMQEHKGGKGTELKLKTGGAMQKYKSGGVVQAYKTGGITKPYKDGGHATMTCKDVGGFISKKKSMPC